MYGLNRPSMLLICGLLVSGACGSKGNPVVPQQQPQQGNPVTVSSVSVAGNNSVTVGKTSQFTATAKSRAGDSIPTGSSALVPGRGQRYLSP